LQTLVLDEADRMLDLGFSEELRDIYAALPKKRQTLLFSATFSDAIRLLAGQMLDNPLGIEVSPRNVAASSVKQWVVPVDKKRKPELFCHLLKKQRWKQVLVFAKTRNGVDQLVERLQGHPPAGTGPLQGQRGADPCGHRRSRARAGHRRPAAGR
jgi:superfamily II DNA/RNA helicase